MKNHLKLSFVVTTSILFTLSFKGYAEELMLLKDSRDKAELPILTTAERQQVVSISRTILDKFYVNLEHKKEFYNVDPIQEFNKIETEIDKLSEFEFQKRMIKIFASVKDYHTNYYLPHPYQCNEVYLPLGFYKIDTKKIVVDRFNQAHLDDLQIKEPIALGDELVSYNGVSAEEYLNAQKEWTSGSTPAADETLALYRLSYISGYESLAPESDYVDLVLKNKKGENYSLHIPWIFYQDQKCFEQKDGSNNDGSNGDSIVDLKRSNFFKKFEKTNRRIQNLNAQKMNLKIFGTGEISTEDPNINYKIITEGDRRYGYIKLSSFQPAKSVSKSLEIIKDILRNKLNDTNALIFDLRGNYGGQINFAESLAAMLYPKKTARIPFYVKANSYTEAVFEQEGVWGQLIRNRSKDDEIVGPSYFQTSNEIKSYSQEYFGKVVLITNAECFSSCDIFASAMKDIAGAKIYGRAASTFGGGANVWKLKDFSYALKKLKLPFEMPRKMGLRATVRHSHRLSTDKLVEDAGIESDIVVPTTYSDIVANEGTILKRVIQDLNTEPNLKLSSSIKLGTTKGYLYLRESENVEKLSASNIDQVVINTLNLDPVKLDINDQSVSINNEMLKKRIQLIELFGFNSEEKVVARNSFWIERLQEFHNVDNYNFNTDPMAYISNPKEESDCGFKNLDNKWYIDNNYCLGTVMKINLALDLSQKSYQKLSFNVDGKLEENFDYFYVDIIKDGTLYQRTEYLTGDIKSLQMIDLKAFANSKIDIQLSVSSDELGTEAGITISNLKFE